MYEEIIKSLRLCREILHEDDSCIEFVDGSCEAFPICAYQLMEKAADAIEELRKSVLRLEDESGIYDELPTFYIYPAKWIPVTEMLPESRQRCLVYTTTYRIGCFANSLEKVSKYDFRGEKHHGWYYHDSGCGYCEILNVTHWMPLPEPPEDGE